MDIDISIIIVNYNTGDLLYNCLKSIADSLSCRYEVIIVDNDSSDSSFLDCERSFSSTPGFVFVQTGENLGFAKANNIGAGLAKGSILHFLNPDTEVRPSLDADYANVLSDPFSLYVNPLVNRDGSLENDRMPVPCIRDLVMWTFHRSSARFWYKGASVILSAANFRKIGGWSEDYFLYSEDLDLFYKVWLCGIQIKTLKSYIFHLGQGSSSRRWSNIEREVVVQKSMRIFFSKYFSTMEYIMVKLWFLFHNMLRHPRTVPFYLKAWYLSSLR